MRRTLTATLALALVAIPCRAEDPPAGDSKVEAARATEAVVLARTEAERYRFDPAGGAKAAPILQPEPLLQWSNPVAGSIHGSVFVWTEAGRPAVVASIYKWYAPNTHLGVEFHTLTPAVASADRDGGRVWTPTSVDLGWKPIPGAPAPGDSPATRLRQLRALAKEFEATETTREGNTRNLRLLTQPIYRYASTDPEVIDGGIFAFVEGTDPEILLLIEARRAGGGVEWQSAAVRMNSIDLRLRHKGREAWNAPTISWSEVGDHRRPYTVFIHGVDPVRLPVRARD